MLEFGSMNKALKHAWIERFDKDNKASWKIVPNETTSHLGEFSFLLSCNYKFKETETTQLPKFYQNILKFWEEVTNTTTSFAKK